MGVKNLLRRIINREPDAQSFAVIPDSEGLNLVLPGDVFRQCENGMGDSWALHQFAALQMLVEQGLAERIANGFVIPSEEAVRLDDDARRLLNTLPRFDGAFKALVSGQCSQSAFSIRLSIVLGHSEIPNYKLNGPCLQLSENEIFLLDEVQWLALTSVTAHQALSPGEKTEQRNLRLVYELQEAKKQGLSIDLSHFNQLKIVHPEKVGVAARQADDGGLILTPTFGSGSSPDDIETRLGQLSGQKDVGTLRVRDEIILLDEGRLKATHEVLTNRRIPKEQVKTFLKSPSAFLDAALVDLDTGFSIRVKGATKFHHSYFGDTDESGIDWFGKLAQASTAESLSKLINSRDDLDQIRAQIKDAGEHGAESITVGETVIDLSDKEAVQQQLDAIEKRIEQKADGPAQTERPQSAQESESKETVVVDIATNDDELEFGESDLLRQAEGAFFEAPIDYSAYKRQPFPHQDEGIRWLLGLAVESLKTNRGGIQGGLLADDMGLGKTFMSLVGIGEFYRLLDRRSETQRPVLVVAPLSLIENWVDETDKTYLKSPFRDVVVLQSGADLRRFKVQGAGRETRQSLSDEQTSDVDAIRYALKIGKDYGVDRLDLPRRLVLTTYQTLRDYQFSMCRVDWSIVVFDEAQNIKNPNALQTRAAKGLKAQFKLLATGTPVENTLADFWCLFDTAQPGLLESYQAFRQHYIQPINNASPEEVAEQRVKIGKMLRGNVGRFMLRRLKEDNLQGLPRKRIHVGANVGDQSDWLYSESLAQIMNGRQLQAYDAVVEGVQARKLEADGDTRGILLGALQQLREISLYPDLTDESQLITSSAKDALNRAQLSGKLSIMFKHLGEIKAREEKVIIFLINKKLQRILKIWVSQVFAIPVDVINGETKAVATKKGAETRKKIIENFEAQPGFGVLIMSPIAAGVGLTVVGANNVIHLERHWNPAKEAQATDRVYRIGQQRDVNIYLPILHHPEHTSFDLNLNALLQRKTNLKDAVVTPQEVSPDEMSGVFDLAAVTGRK